MSLHRTFNQFLGRLRKPQPENLEAVHRQDEALLIAQSEAATATDAPRGLQPAADLWERVEISNQPAVLPPIGSAPVIAAPAASSAAVSTGLGWGWYAAGGLGVAAAAGGGGGGGSSAPAGTTSADTTAPTVTSFNPADGATGVVVGSDLFVTFSEPIALGTGLIVLRDAAGNAVESFDAATSLALTVNGNTLTVNPGLNLGYSSSYRLEIAGTAVTDGAENAYAGTTTYDFTTESSSSAAPRGSVIDLGQFGKLIAPVQVDGNNWYYYWDRSGDGTTNNTGSLNGGQDYTAHGYLDGIFTQDVNGNVDGGGKTTDTYRYATLNGVRVALPTLGGPVPLSGRSYYADGTAIDNNPAGETNVTYNDLLAIWDGHNGTVIGSEQVVAGTPSGWRANSFWSATPSPSGYAYVGLGSGYVGDSSGFGAYVALLVL